MVLILGGVSNMSIAQGVNLSGKITDEKGLPLSKASLYIKELKKTAQTDTAGKYFIKDIKEGTHTLIISHIGRKQQVHTISIYGDEVADFTLLNDSKNLSEVLVTAARTMNERPVNIGKIAIKPMDLPQGVTIIGGDVLEQQQVSRLSDVIKNVNGVYLRSTRGSASEFLYARGYIVSSDNIFKNGHKINAMIMPEVSSLEKVEILKGSAAVLYGEVAPGAVINMVTKRPKFEQGIEVAIRTGSNNLYKPTFDIYGPINSKIAYRVNGAYETADSFRDHVHSDRYYVNPSLLFKLGTKTDLLVQGDYLQHKYTPDFGTGAINKVIVDMHRSNFFGASWSYATAQQTTASISLNHHLNEAWQLNTTASYQLYKRDYQSTERIQPSANGDWKRPLGKNKTDDVRYAGQINLTGKFKTGTFEHTLLTGGDIDRGSTKNYIYTKGNKYLGANNKPLDIIYDEINILDPNKYTPFNDIPVMNPFDVTKTPLNRFGIYINDLINISEKVKVLAGMRWSYRSAPSVKTISMISNTISYGKEQTDQAFSPRLGLVYKLSPNTSVFASYANSFSMNNAKDVDGNTLKPSLIDQYELGAKNDFFKGLLSANLTLYRIVNNDLAQTAQFGKDGITPNNDSNIKALVGQTKSDGIELDLSSRPLAGLSILAGYSYNFMRFTTTPNTKGSYIAGDRLVNTPTHTANASFFYEFSGKKFKGFQVGAAANYIGERVAGWNRTVGGDDLKRGPFTVSGFTMLDLSAGYSYKRFSLLSKVSNVGNILNYYVHENYSVNPVAPRQFSATLSYKL